VWDRIVEEHKEIVSAIARRDPERAELAAKAHLRILEGIWEAERGYSLSRKLPDFLSEPLPQSDATRSAVEHSSHRAS
jgi:hypothetical protein